MSATSNFHKSQHDGRDCGADVYIQSADGSNDQDDEIERKTKDVTNTNMGEIDRCDDEHQNSENIVEIVDIVNKEGRLESNGNININNKSKNSKYKISPSTNTQQDKQSDSHNLPGVDPVHQFHQHQSQSKKAVHSQRLAAKENLHTFNYAKLYQPPSIPAGRNRSDEGGARPLSFLAEEYLAALEEQSHYSKNSKGSTSWRDGDGDHENDESHRNDGSDDDISIQSNYSTQSNRSISSTSTNSSSSSVVMRIQQKREAGLLPPLSSVTSVPQSLSSSPTKSGVYLPFKYFHTNADDDDDDEEDDIDDLSSVGYDGGNDEHDDGQILDTREDIGGKVLLLKEDDDNDSKVEEKGVIEKSEVRVPDETCTEFTNENAEECQLESDAEDAPTAITEGQLPMASSSSSVGESVYSAESEGTAPPTVGAVSSGRVAELASQTEGNGVKDGDGNSNIEVKRVRSKVETSEESTEAKENIIEEKTRDAVETRMISICDENDEMEQTTTFHEARSPSPQASSSSVASSLESEETETMAISSFSPGRVSELASQIEEKEQENEVREVRVGVVDDSTAEHQSLSSSPSSSSTSPPSSPQGANALHPSPAVPSLSLGSDKGSKLQMEQEIEEQNIEGERSVQLDAKGTKVEISSLLSQLPNQSSSLTFKETALHTSPTVSSLSTGTVTESVSQIEEDAREHEGKHAKVEPESVAAASSPSISTETTESEESTGENDTLVSTVFQPKSVTDITSTTIQVAAATTAIDSEKVDATSAETNGADANLENEGDECVSTDPDGSNDERKENDDMTPASAVVENSDVGKSDGLEAGAIGVAENVLNDEVNEESCANCETKHYKEEERLAETAVRVTEDNGSASTEKETNLEPIAMDAISDKIVSATESSDFAHIAEILCRSDSEDEGDNVLVKINPYTAESSDDEDSIMVVGQSSQADIISSSTNITSGVRDHESSGNVARSGGVGNTEMSENVCEIDDNGNTGEEESVDEKEGDRTPVDVYKRWMHLSSKCTAIEGIELDNYGGGNDVEECRSDADVKLSLLAAPASGEVEEMSPSKLLPDIESSETILFVSKMELEDPISIQEEQHPGMSELNDLEHHYETVDEEAQMQQPTSITKTPPVLDDCDIRMVKATDAENTPSESTPISGDEAPSLPPPKSTSSIEPIEHETRKKCRYLLLLTILTATAIIATGVGVGVQRKRNDFINRAVVIVTPPPTFLPTATPTDRPSISYRPSWQPTYTNPPTNSPSMVPSNVPSNHPSEYPSLIPSLSSVPSATPSFQPSVSFAPSTLPSTSPSTSPSRIPSTTPSLLPSNSPSQKPSKFPSVSPSTIPSTMPSYVPSKYPSVSPSFMPSSLPSLSTRPSATPSTSPSSSARPSSSPSTSAMPSALPSISPSKSSSPSRSPSASPSEIPSTSMVPSSSPSLEIEPLRTLLNNALQTRIIGGESLGRKLYKENSLSHRTLQWLYYDMIYYDHFTDEEKIQFFALGCLYYETRGSQWNLDTYWMSEDTMAWSFVVNSTSGTNTSAYIEGVGSERSGVDYGLLTVCSWHGLKCDVNGYITEIQLPNNRLIRDIPREIGLLKYLQYLGVADNSLGELDPFLFEMESLEVIDFDGNGVVELPKYIPERSIVKELYLARNEIRFIDESIVNLKQLEVLWLYENSLESSLPSFISELRSLVELDVEDNYLSGQLPSTLPQMRKLERFYANDNLLSGLLSSSPIINTTSLKSLDLSTNYYYGTIPTEFGAMAKMEELYLQDNELEGSIPREIFGLKRLKDLYLGRNYLSSTLPEEIGNARSLVAFRAEHNYREDLNKTITSKGIFGSIPSTIRHLGSLEQLRLQNNYIEDFFLEEFSELIMLTELRLDLNLIKGTIPASIGNLVNLEELQLWGNYMTGTLPSEIRGCEPMRNLQLYDNAFTGTIPTEWGIFRNLTVLDLSYNKLTGPVPTEFGNFKNMTEMYVESNRLYGFMPDEVCQLAEGGDLMEIGANCDLPKGHTSPPTLEPTGSPTTNSPTSSVSEMIRRRFLQINNPEAPSLGPTTKEPSPEPTKEPTPEPTKEPTPEPTKEPTPEPTKEPTPEPTKEPTPEPTTKQPTNEPTNEPTPEPTTKQPTSEPKKEPTPEPMQEPSSKPTEETTSEPTTREPTPEPTPFPTPLQSPEPKSVQPTGNPSEADVETEGPTSSPTAVTGMSTNTPSSSPNFYSIQPATKEPPSLEPSRNPTNKPTSDSTKEPTLKPTEISTNDPTQIPSSFQPMTSRPSTTVLTPDPTAVRLTSPTFSPSKTSSNNPQSPTFVPLSLSPSDLVTEIHYPTSVPSMYDTNAPSLAPSHRPSKSPHGLPSNQPSLAPSSLPFFLPSFIPSENPSLSAPPSFFPSSEPSFSPTLSPTFPPTMEPTLYPTVSPTYKPTKAPTPSPTLKPTKSPTISPTSLPSTSQEPSNAPSVEYFWMCPCCTYCIKE